MTADNIALGAVIIATYFVTEEITKWTPSMI